MTGWKQEDEKDSIGDVSWASKRNASATALSGTMDVIAFFGILGIIGFEFWALNRMRYQERMSRCRQASLPFSFFDILE